MSVDPLFRDFLAEERADPLVGYTPHLQLAPRSTTHDTALLRLRRRRAGQTHAQVVRSSRLESFRDGELAVDRSGHGQELGADARAGRKDALSACGRPWSGSGGDERGKGGWGAD